MNYPKKNNEQVPMTRRDHPHLKPKQLKRDSEVVKRLVAIQNDNQHNEEKLKEELMACWILNFKNLSDERFWEMLRTIWILCGSLKTLWLFKGWFKSKRRAKYCFSTPEEAAELRALPDEFTVYRACDTVHDGGISWTLSKDYAHFYQEQFKKRMVLVATVKKQHIFALINRNKESEVLILHKLLEETKTPA